MPDGSKRARRNGKRGEARRIWYAHYRAVRFAKHTTQGEHHDDLQGVKRPLRGGERFGR